MLRQFNEVTHVPLYMDSDLSRPLSQRDQEMRNQFTDDTIEYWLSQKKHSLKYKQEEAKALKQIG